MPEPLTGEDIMRRLWANFQAQKPVIMLNMFRGIPVSHPATLAIISQKYAALNVSGLQAACVSLEKRAFLQSEFLPDVVQAYPVSVDVVHGEVILTRFSQTGVNFARRMSMRVQPRESVRVLIHTIDSTFPGSLADLSDKGMGIYTFGAYVNQEIALNRNKEVRIELILPLVEQQLELHGRVISISQERFTLLNRCGIEILAEPASELFIQEFIAQRRQQIFHELEGVYQNICQRHSPTPNPALKGGE